jgi:hypothetical protein
VKARRCARLAGFLLLKREFTQAVGRILAQHETWRDAGDPPATERAMPRKNQYQAFGPLMPGSGRRPSPPPELTAREAKIWRDVTQRLPASWFTSDNAMLLKELCRHIRHADDLSIDLTMARTAVDQVRADPKQDPRGKLRAEATAHYFSLLRAHAHQSERMGQLATKLRLTPSSRYAPGKAATEAAKASYPRPWNDWRGGRDEPDPDPEFDEPGEPKTKQ